MTAPEQRTPSDEDLIADLFDELLEQVLEGQEPNLDAILPDRPDLRDRIDETYDLVCNVANRRAPRRPTLAGYEIERELGSGGMGNVYLARQESLGRQVALKVLPHSMGLSQRAKQRFLIEARALAQLRHDNIVRIHSIVDRADLLAYEMEWIDGPSLRQAVDALRAHGPGATLDQLAEILEVDPAVLGTGTLVQYFVRLGMEIARALDEVHRAGLIHRDVKPGNILIRKDGKSVLVDFGLARGQDPTVTRHGAFVGTPIYASPEQLRAGDEALDGRADVYSLAVTLYEAIALSPPFSGPSSTEVLRRIEAGRIPPLRKKAPQVSRDLETVLSKAMEPEAGDRYATAADFADDLERLLHLQPIRARPAGPIRGSIKFARRHRRTLVAGVVGAAVVAAVLVPVITQAGVSEDAQRRAETLAKSARQQLISPESRRTIWRRSVYRGGGLLLWRHAPSAADPLRVALDDYRSAVRLAPDNELLRLERDVVRTALWLRAGSPGFGQQAEAVPTRRQFDEVAERLPPITQLAARQMRRNKSLSALARPGSGATRPHHFSSDSLLSKDNYVEMRQKIDEAEPIDRLGLGLLAFLLGDLRLCELGWSNREVTELDYPLLDAGLGLVLSADGRSGRAYHRLLNAVKAFPDSSVIALELADAAVAINNFELAQEKLDALPAATDDANTTAHRRRIRADMIAKQGDFRGAYAQYKALADQDPSDPTPRHRMARLAMDYGDLAEADTILRSLLSDWPNAASIRLDLARVALKREDHATYLLQAWYAAQQIARYGIDNAPASLSGGLSEGMTRRDLGVQISAGTAEDLLEILRIGGLSRLHTNLLSATGFKPRGDRWGGFEKPLSWWLPPRLAARAEELVGWLTRWERVEFVLRNDSERPARLLTTLPLVLADFPVTLQPLDTPTRLVVTLANKYGYGAWPRLVDILWTEILSASDVQGSQLVREPLITGDRDPNLVYGMAVANAGDVNGDEVEDLLVGNPPSEVEISSGHALLISGADGSVLYEFSHPDPAIHFGYDVAGAGDVDGDGRLDLIVGAPFGQRRAFAAGRAIVFSGRDGSVLLELEGELPGFGVSVDGVGDLNGDGRDDVIVGTPPQDTANTGQGWVHAFSGADGTVLDVYHGHTNGVWFGADVGRAGDVDADGIPDVIVGGNHGGSPGLVRVFSGRDGSVLHTWYGESDSADFARSVGAAGDVDRDGFDDLLIGVPDFRDNATGSVLVLSGRDGSVIQTLRGDRTGERFGDAVLGLGDINGDNRVELGVGASLGGATRRGCVRVFWGAATNDRSTLYGPRPGSFFGTSFTALKGRTARLAVGAQSGLGPWWSPLSSPR